MKISKKLTSIWPKRTRCNGDTVRSAKTKKRFLNFVVFLFEIKICGVIDFVRVLCIALVYRRNISTTKWWANEVVGTSTIVVWARRQEKELPLHTHYAQWMIQTLCCRAVAFYQFHCRPSHCPQKIQQKMPLVCIDNAIQNLCVRVRLRIWLNFIAHISQILRKSLIHYIQRVSSVIAI